MGTISIVPQDLLPFLTGFLNVLLFLQIGAALVRHSIICTYHEIFLSYWPRLHAPDQ